MQKVTPQNHKEWQIQECFQNSAKRLRFIWDALCNLVPFVEYKKREKHPWRSDMSASAK